MVFTRREICRYSIFVHLVSTVQAISSFPIIEPGSLIFRSSLSLLVYVCQIFPLNLIGPKHRKKGEVKQYPKYLPGSKTSRKSNSNYPLGLKS